MNIQEFMQGCKAAWEGRDPARFAALFHVDGQCHNTPFQVQAGRQALAGYWKRILLREDTGGLCAEARIWWHSMPKAPRTSLPLTPTRRRTA